MNVYYNLRFYGELFLYEGSYCTYMTCSIQKEREFFLKKKRRKYIIFFF
jgi:hypothetical protein